MLLLFLIGLVELMILIAGPIIYIFAIFIKQEYDIQHAPEWTAQKEDVTPIQRADIREFLPTRTPVDRWLIYNKNAVIRIADISDTEPVKNIPNSALKGLAEEDVRELIDRLRSLYPSIISRAERTQNGIYIEKKELN